MHIALLVLSGPTVTSMGLYENVLRLSLVEEWSRGINVREIAQVILKLSK